MDPSAILAVLLHESSRESLIAASKDAVLVAPGSMPWEIGNALIAGLRRKRLRLDEAQAAWRSYETIPIRLIEVDMRRAMDAAAAHGLYAYDGYVLEAAHSNRLPLLTLDKALAKAAKQAGVVVVEV